MRKRTDSGFALIDLLFTIGLIGVLSSIALPRLLLAKQSAGAASAIGSLRAIHSAELTFALTCGAGFYAPNLTTLGQVPAGSETTSAFLSPNLTGSNTVARSGYNIKIEADVYAGAPGSCNGLAAGEAARTYRATANPTDADNRRFFGTNVNGTIFEHTSTLDGIMPFIGTPAAGRVIY